MSKMFLQNVNNNIKWKKVPQGIKDEAPDFCFIQEIHLKEEHRKCIKGQVPSPPHTHMHL